MNAPPASAEDDAFLAGLRAGYEHGYDIGRAHGRAEVSIEHAPVPEFRVSGPTRAELIERGHIERDTSRPPALPVRIWAADDWAKADERDLPTTDHGRAEWRRAIAAGRVPAGLADVFAPREGAGRADVRDRDADRFLAHPHGRRRCHPDRRATGLHDMPEDHWLAAVETLRERGHRIDTTLGTGGDRARNETGYALDEHEAPAATADAIRATVADNGRRIAELRGRVQAAEPGGRWTDIRDRQRQATSIQQTDRDAAEFDEPVHEWTVQR